MDVLRARALGLPSAAVFAVAVGTAWAAGALAADEKNPLDACLAQHDSCVAECADAESATGRISCIIGCASAEAQCAATVGARETVPKLKKKADELQKFLDKFLKDMWREIPRPKKKPKGPAKGPEMEKTSAGLRVNE